MDTVAIAPKDISTPPDNITTNTPVARIPGIAIVLKISLTLSLERKEALKEVIIIVKKIKTNSK